MKVKLPDAVQLSVAVGNPKLTPVAPHKPLVVLIFNVIAQAEIEGGVTSLNTFTVTFAVALHPPWVPITV